MEVDDAMDVDVVSPSPHLAQQQQTASFSTAFSQPVHSVYATAATASPRDPSSPSQAAVFRGADVGVLRPLAPSAYKEREYKSPLAQDDEGQGWSPRGDLQQRHCQHPVSPDHEREADSSETSERTRTAQIILSLAASARATAGSRASVGSGSSSFFTSRSLPPPLALHPPSSGTRAGAGAAPEDENEKHTGSSGVSADRSKEASSDRPRGEKEASSPTDRSFLRLIQEGPCILVRAHPEAARASGADNTSQPLALAQPLRAFLDLAVLSEHGIDLAPTLTPGHLSHSLPSASASNPFFRLPASASSSSSLGGSGARARPTPIPLTLAGAHRHSPYPPSARSVSFHATPATATALPPMPVTSGASGPPSTPSRSASHAGAQSQAQFTPPSMSSSARRRRAPVPDWPSPKAVSPGQPSPYGSSRGDGSAGAVALQTPTPLRVPQSAALHSPASSAVRHSTIRPPAAPLPPVYHHYAAAPRSAPLRERQHRGIAASAPPPVSPQVAVPMPIPVTPRTPASAQRARLIQRSPTKATVVKELNSRAGDFWTSPESADVRIIIPVLRTSKTPRTADPQHAQRSQWPSTPSFPGSATGRRGSIHRPADPPSWGGERRGSLPSNMDIPVLVFPLHSQYLIPQSAVFRSLLSSLKPVTEASVSMPRSAGLGPSLPMVKGAKVLPHKKGEPTTIYLPIPDPTSFGVLVHWLYWGDIPALEAALSRGLVTWQGVVKNIEYLSLDDAVKRVLGKWWRTWIKTDVGRGSHSDGGASGEMRPRPGSPITLPMRAASENAKRVPAPPGLQELSDDSESPRSTSGRDGEAAVDGDDEGMDGDDGGVAERLEAL